MSGVYQIPGLFLTALCHVIIVGSMSEQKFPKKKFLLYGCLFSVCFISIGSCGYALGGITAVILYVGMAFCLFLFSCGVSRDCFSRKCFLFISYFCLFSVLDNIFKIVIQLLLPQISAAAEYYAAIVLRSVVLLLILALYERYAAEIFRSLADFSSKRWWNLALIALLFYLAQAALSVVNALTDVQSEILLLALAVVSLIMSAVYGVVFSNINHMKKESETALIRQNTEYLSAQLADLQSAEEMHRRLRHDMRHHLETIAEYAKAGDTDAILSYIGEYSVEVSKTKLRQYAMNRTINSIVSAYAGKAEKNGISFSVRCNVPAELSVRETDLVALLGNLLENALHGCQRSETDQAYIDICIRRQKRRLIIVCENSCPEDLELSGNLPAGKSIGISSILAVCRRYDGNLDYRVKSGICSVCAVLNL